MKVFTDLSTFSFNQPVSVAIGMFDGLHLGHRYLFSRMKRKNKHRLLITFSNSPTAFLLKEKENLLITNEHRLELFNKAKIDGVILIPFDEKIAELDFVPFLENLSTKVQITDLFLGEGASIGKGGKGDFLSLQKLGKRLDISIHRIKKLRFQEKEISTSRIKNVLKSKDFTLAKKLLGKSYSMRLSPQHFLFSIPSSYFQEESTYANSWENITQDLKHFDAKKKKEEDRNTKESNIKETANRYHVYRWENQFSLPIGPYLATFKKGKKRKKTPVIIGKNWVAIPKRKRAKIEKDPFFLLFSPKANQSEKDSSIL